MCVCEYIHVDAYVRDRYTLDNQPNW